MPVASAIPKGQTLPCRPEISDSENRPRLESLQRQWTALRVVGSDANNFRPCPKRRFRKKQRTGKYVVWSVGGRRHWRDRGGVKELRSARSPEGGRRRKLRCSPRTERPRCQPKPSDLPVELAVVKRASDRGAREPVR